MLDLRDPAAPAEEPISTTTPCSWRSPRPDHTRIAAFARRRPPGREPACHVVGDVHRSSSAGHPPRSDLRLEPDARAGRRTRRSVTSPQLGGSRRPASPAAAALDRTAHRRGARDLRRRPETLRRGSTRGRRSPASQPRFRAEGIRLGRIRFRRRPRRREVKLGAISNDGPVDEEAAFARDLAAKRAGPRSHRQAPGHAPPAAASARTSAPRADARRRATARPAHRDHDRPRSRGGRDHLFRDG